jgi:hypothetical protein
MINSHSFRQFLTNNSAVEYLKISVCPTWLCVLVGFLCFERKNIQKE